MSLHLFFFSCVVLFIGLMLIYVNRNSPLEANREEQRMQKSEKSAHKRRQGQMKAEEPTSFPSVSQTYACFVSDWQNFTSIDKVGSWQMNSRSTKALGCFPRMLFVEVAIGFCLRFTDVLPIVNGSRWRQTACHKINHVWYFFMKPKSKIEVCFPTNCWVYFKQCYLLVLIESFSIYAVSLMLT